MFLYFNTCVTTIKCEFVVYLCIEILGNGKLCILEKSLALRMAVVGRLLGFGIVASVFGIHRGLCITRRVSRSNGSGVSTPVIRSRRRMEEGRRGVSSASGDP